MITANIENIREEIINLALQQYGKSYQHGKGDIDTFDCAGLVWFIYNEIMNIDIFEQGFGMSTTTKIMTSKYGKLITYDEKQLNKNLNLVKKGDILFFHRQSLSEFGPTEFNKYPGHCGIYLGNERFIHASKPKQKVIISDFSINAYWLKILVGYKNMLESYQYNNNDNKIYKR